MRKPTTGWGAREHADSHITSGNQSHEGHKLGRREASCGWFSQFACGMPRPGKKPIC